MTDGAGSTSFPVNAWTLWESPAAWTKEHLAHVPPSPGIYMVRRVDPNGDPVRLPVTLADPGGQATPDDLAKRAESWQGVVYVGKAVDLRNRFALLVKSWMPDPPSKPHTSRENWDQKDAAFQAQYPPDAMQVRFKRLSNKDWAVSTLRKAYRPYAESQVGELGWSYTNTNEALDDIDSWFKAHYPHWTKLHGNSEDDINVSSTIEEEQKELGKVRDCFGSFAVLNKDVPQ